MILEATLQPKAAPVKPAAPPPRAPAAPPKPAKPAKKIAPQPAPVALAVPEPALEPLAPNAAPAAEVPPLDAAAAEPPAPPPPARTAVNRDALPDDFSMRLRTQLRRGLLVANGKTEYFWRRRGDRYSLTGVLQATGVATLLTSDRYMQESQGELTDSGLRPDFFANHPGQRSMETVQLDWAAGMATLAAGQEVKRVELPADTTDQLSFLFQFAFVPPQPGEHTLSLVSGSSLDSYAYQVQGEEWLELPIGKLRTVRLVRSATEQQGSLVLWLAIDRHYLPVKARIEKKKTGSVTELVIEELRLEAQTNPDTGDDAPLPTPNSKE